MKTPREFLTALWGDPPPGVILIWTLPKKESHWSTRLDQVNKDMERHAHEDVYTGVGIASKNRNRFTSQNKLTEEEVGGLAGMWTDIDWGHPVHRKPNLPPSLEHAMETLEEARFEPTVLVNSGHGLQAWWLFEEPWIFQNAEDHELGRRAAQWWHQHIKALYTAQGWTTDSVFNLDRIMRLPGTWNNRVPGERRAVEVIREAARRYTPYDFLDLIPEEFQTSTPPPGRTGTRGRGQRRQGGDGNGGNGGNDGNGGNGGNRRLTLDPDAEPSAIRLEALLKANPKFRKSWEQDRTDMDDQSASAYDMSMATIAIRAGWPEQEVVNMLICWRRTHGHDLKLREGYYKITLDKAEEPIQMAQAQEQLNQALLEPPEDQPEVLKDNLDTLLRVDIIRIVKYLGDPPTYYMYTKQGNITLGGIGSITSQTKFRDLVAAATDVWIPAVSRKAWDQRIQAILPVCEPIDVGDASHPAQEMAAWLDEYLLEKPPREEDEWLKAAEAKLPFIQDKKVHIFLDDFRHWLDLTMGQKMTPYIIGLRLRQCEVELDKVNIPIGRYKRSSRSCWELPLGFQTRHEQPPSPEGLDNT